MIKLENKFGGVMDTRINALNHFFSHKDSFLDQLISFVSIPSISTAPENKGDVLRAAEFLVSKMNSIGIKNVKLHPTPGHPIVYGEYLEAGDSQPTILVYGHYDVQPVDPTELWHNDPFSPTVIEDSLFARGSSDMKGQVFACLAAIETILNTDKFPVNLKFIFEGEEEIGSPNLKPFLETHKDLLRSDAALNVDTGMSGKNTPTITYGLRGLSYFEIRVYGPSKDLHSGIYGGVVHNPAQVLIDLISKMHDSEGRVTLPGFYDEVKELSAQERSEFARLNIADEHYQDQTGVPGLWGETGYTPTERIGARPTLEVNGFLSGFTGKGSKTVIPAKAMAKISTRLVPNQKPEKIYHQLVEFMRTHAPETVKWEVEEISTGSPSLSDINLPATRALVTALKEVWGVDPVYKREGGSVPVVADMQEILGIDSVLSGFGLPDDNVHSPNEKLDLPTWYKGIEALIHFFYNVKNA